MSEEICSICLDKLDSDIKIISCNHKFHEKCIDEWFKKSNKCPYCRCNIVDFRLYSSGIPDINREPEGMTGITEITLTIEERIRMNRYTIRNEEGQSRISSINREPQGIIGTIMYQNILYR